MKYSKKLTKEICDHIVDGHTQKGAAKCSNVSETQFYHWLKTKPKFAEAVRHSLTTYKDKLLTLLHASAIAKKDARTALEMLARRFPEEWGEKLKIETTINPHEEYKKMMARVEKAWLKKHKNTTKDSSPGSS